MSRSRLVHFVAHCQDCDWYTDDYINGPRLASRHAKQKKHIVCGDKGYSVRYAGRPKKEL